MVEEMKDDERELFEVVLEMAPTIQEERRKELVQVFMMLLACEVDGLLDMQRVGRVLSALSGSQA